MKNKIIFNKALIFHSKWLAKIELFVKGFETTIYPELVIKTETNFGKWLYGEGQDYKKHKLFNDVVFFHNEIHYTTIKLLVLLNNKSKQTFFNKTTIIKQQKLIKQHFNQIKNDSYKMVQFLILLEEEVLKSKQQTSFNLYKNFNKQTQTTTSQNTLY